AGPRRNGASSKSASAAGTNGTTFPSSQTRVAGELTKTGGRNSAGAARLDRPGGVGYDFDMVYELPLVREAYGFARTSCRCALCQVPCRHLPGALDPSDLPRLCPPGHDLFAWAEQH